MKTQRYLTFLLALCACFGLSAVELYRPLPDGWTVDRAYDTSLPSDDKWWRNFDDSVLDSLILLAEKGNLNLIMTERRIEMARRNCAIAKSGYYPNIGLSAGWTKSRTSGDTEPMGSPGNLSYFSLGLNFSWEVDLFGRVAAQSRQGKANYEASKAEYDAAMISLCSNVATAYFNYRLADAEIGVAIEEISNQEKLVAITEARHKAGLVSKLDVAQAKTMLFSTQTTIPSLESTRTSALNSIATLLGCYPADIAELLETPEYLPNPYIVVATGGIPADLLRRRPDIAEVEAEIAGYAAALGIAKKDFLPSLVINGSIGTEARNIKDLFKDKSFSYNISPTLSWTVFDGLSRTNKIAEAKEQMMLGIDNYNQTVINAVNEVENCMSLYNSSLASIGIQKKVNEQSAEALTLALDRYKRGLDSFINVMDAQETVLENRNALLEINAKALNALVKLYSSLCGAPEASVNN